MKRLWFSEVCEHGDLETDSFKTSTFMGAVPRPRASASPGNWLKMQIVGPLSRSAQSRPLGVQVILMPAHSENHTNPYGLS